MKTTRRFITGNTPPVQGELPVNVPLYLTSLQAPPQPIMNDLFRGLNEAPEDFYGALFQAPDTYHDFPTGMNPVISGFIVGPASSSQTGREFRIYGVNNDDSEDLLLTYSGAGTFNITPKAYKRLRYNVRANGRPNFLKLLGTFNSVSIPDLPYTKYTLGGHMGSNIHPYSILENPNDANDRYNVFPSAMDMAKKMGGLRIYVDNQNINEIQNEFTFDKDRQGYAIDNMMLQLHEQGVTVVWCMQALTQWQIATYPNTDNYERVPVFYNADRLNPASWEPYAEIAFQIALRYGSNTNHTLSESKSKDEYFYPSDPSVGAWTKKIGLGYLTEIEPYNEIDKWWKGLESYASAEELAVGMNVIYQRIKDADPNMKVTYPGIASFSPDMLQEFVYHSKRLYNRIPVDNYAYHVYPSTSGSQYASGESVGAVPELWYYPESMSNFRKSIQHRLGNKPFDCGEIGFDSTTNSPLRAVVPTGSGYTQRQWAGIMYLRVALFNAKNGVRRTYHYQWNDLSDDQYNQFSAMGMCHVTGNSPNKVFTPYPNLYLMGQVRDLFGNYTHDSQLSSSPLVDKWVYQGSVMYSVYNPTETNLSQNYNLPLPTGTKIEVIDLNLNSFTPTVTQVTTTGSVYTVNCIEKPKFIRVVEEGQGSTGLAALDATMDAIWENRISARDAKKQNGSQALKGDGVFILPCRKGTRDMHWVGPENPLLGMPYLDYQDRFIDNYSLPFVWYKNASGYIHASDETDGLSEERTVTMSLLFPDYQIYEGFLKAYGTVYLGTSNARNSNSSPFTLTLRTTNDDTTQLDVPNFAVNAVHHIVYVMKREGNESENPGKIGVKLWLDGVLLNPSLSKETFNTLKRIEVVGADTNCMTMGFLEMSTAYRAMSTSDINATFNALKAFYGNFNTPINLPTPTNINVSKIGNQVTATIEIIKSLGFAEDLSKRIVIWERGVLLQTMYQINELNNLSTFNISTASGSGSAWRCSIFITDTNNNQLKLPAIWFGNLS